MSFIVSAPFGLVLLVDLVLLLLAHRGHLILLEGRHLVWHHVLCLHLSSAWLNHADHGHLPLHRIRLGHVAIVCRGHLHVEHPSHILHLYLVLLHLILLLLKLGLLLLHLICSVIHIFQKMKKLILF